MLVSLRREAEASDTMGFQILLQWRQALRRIRYGIVGLASLSGLVAHAHIIPIPDVQPAAAAYLAPGASGKTWPATEWVVEVDRLDGQPASRAVRTGESVSLSLRNLGEKSIDVAVVLSQSEAMTPMANSQPVTIHLLAGERQEWRMQATRPLRIFVSASPEWAK